MELRTGEGWRQMLVSKMGCKGGSVDAGGGKRLGEEDQEEEEGGAGSAAV